jgi:hypothetical protein
MAGPKLNVTPIRGTLFALLSGPIVPGKPSVETRPAAAPSGCLPRSHRLHLSCNLLRYLSQSEIPWLTTHSPPIRPCTPRLVAVSRSTSVKLRVEPARRPSMPTPKPHPFAWLRVAPMCPPGRAECGLSAPTRHRCSFLMPPQASVVGHFAPPVRSQRKSNFTCKTSDKTKKLPILLLADSS